MDKQEAIELICQVSLEWAGEYGFVNPDKAGKVFSAVELFRPDLVEEFENS